MTRSELINNIVASHPSLSVRDVEKLVTAVFEEMAESLLKRERVELRGFGSFQVKKRNARRGRNPKTGAPVNVVSKDVPFFRSGKEVRARIN